MSLLRRGKRLSRALIALLLFAPWAAPLSAQEWLDDPLPEDPGFESISPEDLIPSSVVPGLSNVRGVPPRPGPTLPIAREPLFLLTRPVFGVRTLPVLPEYLPAPDPSSFRSVLAYQPPIGLQPRVYRSGLIEFYPRFGMSQTFDNNVNLTPTGPIADFYITPRAAAELQIGTPDSAGIERLDTIIALRASYEAYGDIFYVHPELSAFNQKFDLSLRVGRSSAIWRPYVFFSDVTGTDLLTTELSNRTRRIRVSPGITSDYKFTERLTASQTVSYFHFGHSDPAYNNFDIFQVRQDLGYRVWNETSALIWAGYRHTEPDRGSPGDEAFVGVGWRGKPDPRLFTQMNIGYGLVDLRNTPPGARDQSGLRFTGYTTWQWSPRLAFTLIYDRDYVFNELGNDNYVSTLLQGKAELFLGGNWYVTPYFGAGTSEFQLSGAVTFQIRPEIEISYVLPTDDNPNKSRVFAKFGYTYSANIVGEGLPISGARVSLGWAWTF